MRRILALLVLAAALCLTAGSPSWAHPIQAIEYVGVVQGFAPQTVVLETATGEVLVPASAVFDVNGYTVPVSSLAIGTPVTAFVEDTEVALILPGEPETPPGAYDGMDYGYYPAYSSEYYPYDNTGYSASFYDSSYSDAGYDFTDYSYDNGSYDNGYSSGYNYPVDYGAAMYSQTYTTYDVAEVIVPPPTFSAFVATEPVFVAPVGGPTMLIPASASFAIGNVSLGFASAVPVNTYGFYQPAYPMFVPSSTAFFQFGDVGLGYATATPMYAPGFFAPTAFMPTSALSLSLGNGAFLSFTSASPMFATGPTIFPVAPYGYPYYGFTDYSYGYAPYSPVVASPFGYSMTSLSFGDVSLSFMSGSPFSPYGYSPYGFAPYGFGPSSTFTLGLGGNAFLSFVSQPMVPAYGFAAAPYYNPYAYYGYAPAYPYSYGYAGNPYGYSYGYSPSYAWAPQTYYAAPAFVDPAAPRRPMNPAFTTTVRAHPASEMHFSRSPRAVNMASWQPAPASPNRSGEVRAQQGIPARTGSRPGSAPPNAHRGGQATTQTGPGPHGHPGIGPPKPIIPVGPLHAHAGTNPNHNPSVVPHAHGGPNIGAGTHPNVRTGPALHAHGGPNVGTRQLGTHVAPRAHGAPVIRADSAERARSSSGTHLHPKLSPIPPRATVHQPAAHQPARMAPRPSVPQVAAPPHPHVNHVAPTHASPPPVHVAPSHPAPPRVTAPPHVNHVAPTHVSPPPVHMAPSHPAPPRVTAPAPRPHVNVAPTHAAPPPVHVAPSHPAPPRVSAPPAPRPQFHAAPPSPPRVTAPPPPRPEYHVAPQHTAPPPVMAPPHVAPPAPPPVTAPQPHREAPAPPVMAPPRMAPPAPPPVMAPPPQRQAPPPPPVTAPPPRMAPPAPPPVMAPPPQRQAPPPPPVTAPPPRSAPPLSAPQAPQQPRPRDHQNGE